MMQRVWSNVMGMRGRELADIMLVALNTNAALRQTILWRGENIDLANVQEEIDSRQKRADEGEQHD